MEDSPRGQRSADPLRDRLREALAENLAQQEALVREHGRIVDAALSSNADDEHDPEGATIAFEREQVTALLDRARHGADELRAALERLAGDRYGVCEGCGGPIAPERLEARPDARTCIDCARRARSARR